MNIAVDMTRKRKNIVGPLVRKRRYSLGWTQAELAVKLQIAGWDLDRSGVSKLESGSVWVGDFEMLYLAAALKIEVWHLYPATGLEKNLHDSITKWRERR